MKIHDTNIGKSIDLNIIGTCNLVKEAFLRKIKFIYLSTSYVYPGIRGNYNENDFLKPWNNYGWSKLGGECAVQMYKNSLILRRTDKKNKTFLKRNMLDTRYFIKICVTDSLTNMIKS